MALRNQLFLCAFIFLFHSVFNNTMASIHPDTKTPPLPTEWVVPFKLVKDLIVVEAFVNGKKGKFIVDTGTRYIILNSKYFKGEMNNEFQNSDFGGNKSRMGETMVGFNWSNRKEKSHLALVSDLSSLEKILRIKIMGYIGYNVLKKQEVVFDYQQKYLTLFELDRKGKRKNPSLISNVPSDTIPLYKNGFQPYLVVSIGTKQFRFGIDSGATINMFNEDQLNEVGSDFQTGNSQKIAGFNGKEMSVLSGMINEIYIENNEWTSMNYVVKDLGYLNGILLRKLDGLLGYEFLKQYKTSINYRKNQMYIWKPELLTTDEYTAN